MSEEKSEGGGIGGALAALAAAAAMLFMCWHYAPQFWSDVWRKSEFAVAYDMQVQKAECTRYNFIATDCAIVATDAAGVRHEVNFIKWGWVDSRFHMMRSTRDPSIVTTTSALDTLLGRFFLLLTLGGGGLLILLGALSAGLSRLTGREQPRPAVRTAPQGAAPSGAVASPASARTTFGKR